MRPDSIDLGQQLSAASCISGPTALVAEHDGPGAEPELDHEQQL